MLPPARVGQWGRGIVVAAATLEHSFYFRQCAAFAFIFIFHVVSLATQSLHIRSHNGRIGTLLAPCLGAADALVVYLRLLVTAEVRFVSLLGAGTTLFEIHQLQRTTTQLPLVPMVIQVNMPLIEMHRSAG